MPAAADKIRVLIVDDSASVRRALAEIVASDPALEVMATAADPYEAAEQIKRAVPDVIFLDIEMPRMDGLTFLRKIMAQRPIPVVICSSLTEEGSEALMKALESGAVDVVTKPKIGTARFLQEARMRICDTAKAAAQARLFGGRRAPPRLEPQAKLTADAVIPPAAASAAPKIATEPVICIGASTGGTEALRVILQSLPPDAPGVAVVQHMPERFTAAFARRLDGLCAVEVKEAEPGDALTAGRVLVAPGDRHMLLRRVGRRYEVALDDGPHVRRHRPSVDVLFRSAAQCAGPNAAAALLTGMGDDGAQGLLELRQSGARTFAQDEATSIVFGMPKEAIALGAAMKVLPLTRIAAELLIAARPAVGRGAA
ncbi:MAG: chemotaxis response regulator protein-glutamate methylesterase [Phenylobacterium sp.]|uniref:protein-glutamate methylesterase/protein-glutamine glutaminase n=1 Tax=Phenylobacterium sp. TaxID=1871053 RepID=UPI00391D8099